MASKLYGVNATIIIFMFVLYCIVLYCIVLYCIVMYCIVSYCIVLYCHCCCCYCRPGVELVVVVARGLGGPEGGASTSGTQQDKQRHKDTYRYLGGGGRGGRERKERERGEG